MKYKTFSREELIEMLSNGIQMPKSSLVDEDTIIFYFEELLSFIKLADNTYDAKSSDYLEITATVDDLDFVILRYVGNKVFLFLANTRPDIIDTMTSQEATDIIGLVYGITVFNEKWVEVNELVEAFTEELIMDIEQKSKPKFDPKILEKLNKSTVQYPDKTMKPKDFHKYFKKDKDKKYG